MLGRVAEGSPTLFSLSISCLGICFHRKPLTALSFIVLRSRRRRLLSQAPLACTAARVCLLHGSPLSFLLCCPGAFIPSGVLCLSGSLPNTMCLGLYPVYPYSMCLSPCVFLVFVLFFFLHSHSLPYSHILSAWVVLSVCLFSVSLFI